MVQVLRSPTSLHTHAVANAALDVERKEIVPRGTPRKDVGPQKLVT